ncbi:MAG: helix-turn-helix domain-containing protein, partial [Candidatus Ratteibacteria bacterium]
MTDRERQIKMKLGWFRHVKEVTGNVAKTCRYFGISRKTYYKWYNRYLKYGEEGLVDGSKRPKHCPRATCPEIIEKIVYLRTNYHFGPTRIKMYLERYHNIHINNSTVWKILKRLNMNRLPYNQRYKPHIQRFKRYEKPIPGYYLQVDV